MHKKAHQIFTCALIRTRETKRAVTVRERRILRNYILLNYPQCSSFRLLSCVKVVYKNRCLFLNFVLRSLLLAYLLMSFVFYLGTTSWLLTSGFIHGYLRICNLFLPNLINLRLYVDTSTSTNKESNVNDRLIMIRGCILFHFIGLGKIIKGHHNYYIKLMNE